MRVVVIGQSVTAIKFLEQLRSQHHDAELIVVAFDEHLPVLIERFPELIARQISRADVIYHDEKFFQNRRIEIINDKKISRINFNKRTIFFDDKSRIEADMIIIADADKDQFPDIKGVNKEGVFSLRSYGQLNIFLNNVNCVDTIMIESKSLRGMALAQAMAAQDKEVIFCLSSDRFWPGRFDQASSDFIVSLLQHLGVRVLRNTQISEVLGEKDAKAVRLSVSKVLAAEMVIFPDALPDTRLYAKSDIVVDGQIKTDELFRTNFEGVFAIDNMAQRTSDASKYCDMPSCRDDQVTRLNAAFNNNEFDVPESDCVHSFDIASHAITVIGDLSAQDGEALVKKDENGFLQKRILIKNNVVQGAFLVDNNNDIAELLMMVKNKQAIDLQHSEWLSDCVKEGEHQDLAEVVDVEGATSDQNNDEMTASEANDSPADEEVKTETTG